MTNRISNILLILAVIVFSLSLLENSLTKPLARDEHMYCTGAALIAQGKTIYKDFSYIAQLPCHPLILAGIYKISNTTHFLLTARLFSAVCDIIILICIAGVFRTVFKDYKILGDMLAIAGCALWIFNPLVKYANGFAWNHDFVILCVIASFWLYISIDFNIKRQYWKLSVIGGLLSLASFSRPTTFLVALLFFIMILIQSFCSVREKIKAIAYFIISAFVIGFWPAYLILSAPRASFLNIIKIPELNGQLLHFTGKYFQKIPLTFFSLVRPAYFILIIIFLGLWLTLLIIKTFKGSTSEIKKEVNPAIAITGLNSAKRNALFSVLLIVVFFVIVYIPPTIWWQYFAVPVPFIIVGLAYPLLYLKKTNRERLFGVVLSVFAGCVIAIGLNCHVLTPIPKLLQPELWIPLHVHNVAIKIARNTHDSERMLTLSPLYVIESGGQIYIQLSAGVFAYRVADMLSREERQLSHTMGHTSILDIIFDLPPDRVILRVEEKIYEEPIKKATVYYKPDEWEKVPSRRGPVVYIKKNANEPPLNSGIQRL